MLIIVNVMHDSYLLLLSVTDLKVSNIKSQYRCSNETQESALPRKRGQELTNNWQGYQDQDIKRNDESKAKPGPEVAVIGLSLAPQPVRAGALRDCTSTYCRIASTPQAHTAG